MFNQVMHFNFLFYLIVISFIEVTVAYRKYYVEDECISQDKFQKVVFRLPGSGPDSVGELRTNRFGTYSRTGRKCLLQLVPPTGHGVLVTVLKVDFQNHQGCRDYIKIYDNGEDGEKLCGFQLIGSQGKTFFAEKELKILYHTSEGGLGFSSGFKLIFTITKLDGETSSCTSPSDFKCDNSRCIWAGAVCDGVNNCGDSSDESSFQNCSEVTPLAIVAIVLGVCTVIGIAIVMCMCCCRAQAVKQQKLPFEQIILKPHVEYTPLHGYIPIAGQSYGAMESRNNHDGFVNMFATRTYATRTSPSAPPYPLEHILPYAAQKFEVRYDQPPPYKP